MRMEMSSFRKIQKCKRYFWFILGIDVKSKKNWKNFLNFFFSLRELNIMKIKTFKAMNEFDIKRHVPDFQLFIPNFI